MKKLSLVTLAAFLMLSLAAGFAMAEGKCFLATGKLSADAQTIRTTALEMGWKVGKTASFTASSVAKSKVKMYPKGKVQVCLRPNPVKRGLQIKIQADSKDAGKAKWRKLPAKKVASAPAVKPAPAKPTGK